MPKPWDLLSPDVQQRVKSPPLANASPTQVANEIYDVLGQVLSRQLSTTGNVSIGSVIIDESGIRLFSAGKNTIYLDVDGDAFFGSDLAEASTSSLIILNNDQVYNDEELSEGDILLGDNSSGAANLFWDRSTGKLQFRGGTTMQVEIDTDGSLLAGGGVVTLDNDGITLTAGATDVNYIKFQDTSNNRRIGIIYGNPGILPGVVVRGEGNAAGVVGYVHLTSYNSDASAELYLLSGFLNSSSQGFVITEGSWVFNEAGAAYADLRIEGDNIANLFVTDAGVDSLGIGTATFDSTGRQVLVFDNGTPPAGSVTDAAQLWVADVAAGNADFRMRTEGGTVGRILNVVTTVARVTDQTLTTSSEAAIQFTSEVIDDEGWHDNVTNNTRITVTEAGEYLATGYTEFATNSTGQRFVKIVDSAGNIWAYQGGLAVPSINTRLCVSGQRTMAAGAYIEMTAFQNSGGDLAINPSRLTLIKLR